MVHLQCTGTLSLHLHLRIANRLRQGSLWSNQRQGVTFLHQRGPGSAGFKESNFGHSTSQVESEYQTHFGELKRFLWRRLRTLSRIDGTRRKSITTPGWSRNGPQDGGRRKESTPSGAACFRVVVPKRRRMAVQSWIGSSRVSGSMRLRAHPRVR